MLLIVAQAGIAGGRIAWMRLGKVLKAHGYGPCTLDTGNPCSYDGLFGLCRSAECSLRNREEF